MKKLNELLSVIQKIAVIFSLVYISISFNYLSQNNRYIGDIGNIIDTRTGATYLHEGDSTNTRVWGMPILR